MMKYWASLILIVLVLILFNGCAQQKKPKVSVPEIDEKLVYISTEDGTVTYDGEVYHYVYTTRGNGYSLFVIFPNVYTCYEEGNGSSKMRGTFLDTTGSPSQKSEEMLGYLSMDTIFDLVSSAEAKNNSGLKNGVLSMAC